MAPGARNGPMKPPEIISTLTGTCMPSDLVLSRCSPEPGLRVARLCRSANNPAKSPPFSPPPHGGASVRMESERKLRQGQQAGMGGQALLPPYAVGPFACGPFLNLGAGRPLDKIGRGPCTSGQSACTSRRLISGCIPFILYRIEVFYDHVDTLPYAPALTSTSHRVGHCAI